MTSAIQQVSLPHTVFTLRNLHLGVMFCTSLPCATSKSSAIKTLSFRRSLIFVKLKHRKLLAHFTKYWHQWRRLREVKRGWSVYLITPFHTSSLFNKKKCILLMKKNIQGNHLFAMFALMLDHFRLYTYIDPKVDLKQYQGYLFTNFYL